MNNTFIIQIKHLLILINIASFISLFIYGCFYHLSFEIISLSDSTKKLNTNIEVCLQSKYRDFIDLR